MGFLLTCVLFFSMVPTVFASQNQLEPILTETAKYIYHKVKSPEVGSVGGEWAVLGLSRSSYDIPNEYYETYYRNVEKYVKKHKGILHNKKYTEYSKLIIALTAIGKDPRNVSGYNLLIPLGDYEQTIWQGVNGPIWALIALDSGNYNIPKNPTAKIQATREQYIQYILDCQLEDGGWSLTESKGSISDPDVTGMALQALARYQNIPEVKTACFDALECMSRRQNQKGGFSSNWEEDTSESCSQMLVGLCEMGISLDDQRFVKNNHSVLDALLSFRQEDHGFLHSQNGQSSNQMASEQAFYALVAVERSEQNKNSLYHMSDAIKRETTEKVVGFTNSNHNIQVTRVENTKQIFTDVQEHENQVAIEELAKREILRGKTDMLFDPNATMTRAEFATIIVKALKLEPKESYKFSDVNSSDWFAKYVGAANQYGIVSGKSETTFDPMGNITREEAATMISRAAKLCGMDVKRDKMYARDTLSQFIDYVKCSDWAMESLAFCYDENILDSSVLKIQPDKPMKRCEIAQMVFNLLKSARLI